MSALGAKPEAALPPPPARDPRLRELDILALRQEIRELRDGSSQEARWRTAEERAARITLLARRLNRLVARSQRERYREWMRASKYYVEPPWRARRAAYLARAGRFDDLRREGYQ